MNVLEHRDVCALLGTSLNESSRKDQIQTYSAGKHRPIPRRLYLVGAVIYNGIIAAAVGAASWAFLVLVLSPIAP